MQIIRIDNDGRIEMESGTDDKYHYNYLQARNKRIRLVSGESESETGPTDETVRIIHHLRARCRNSSRI